MSLRGKNRKIFSYINSDVKNKKFLNKDFDKTCSYHSNFSESTFENTSFKAAKFKFCSFYGVTFKSCDFVGSLLKSCNLSGANFKKCIIRSSDLKNSRIGMDCIFEDCYIIDSNLPSKKVILKNTKILKKLEPEECFDAKLINEIKKLKLNDFIRRSNVFHLKKDRINTASIQFLLNTFTESELVCLLPQVANSVSKDFYTLSYIQKILEKQKNLLEC